MAIAMARLANTAPLAHVEVVDVSSLIDSQSRALTLGNAAIQGCKSTSLQMLWARGSQGVDKTSAGEKQRIRGRVENFEAILASLDATRGKTGSDERDRWKSDVIESVVDLIASMSLEQVKTVDENVEAISTAVGISVASDTTKVTDHLADSIAQLRKLQSEHRIEIDGIESRRRDCIALFNERDAKLVAMQSQCSRQNFHASTTTEAPRTR